MPGEGEMMRRKAEGGRISDDGSEGCEKERRLKPRLRWIRYLGVVRMA